MRPYKFLTIICLLAWGCSKSSDNATKPNQTAGTPSAPIAQAPASSAIGTTSFTASWRKVSGADKYMVFVAADNQFTQPVTNYNPATVTDTTLTVNNLAPGASYFYKVQASENGVAGAYSNVVSVTTQALQPALWQPVGVAGFSAGGVEYNTSLAINNNNVPYIAYQDAAYGGAATVMKFNGNSWSPVGTAGFTNNGIGLISMAIDKSSNTPYVAYRDFDGYFVVQKFINGGWTILGTAQTLPIVGQPSIVIDSYGNPYVGVIDFGDSDKATVMEYNGTGWVPVGAEGISPDGNLAFISLAFDSNGKLYAAYDDGTGSSVELFNGTNWVYVGPDHFNGSTSSYTTLAIYNTTLYVGYASNQQIGQPECMVYNGSYWAQEGSYFSGLNYYPSFALDNSGNPYLAFQQNTDAYHSVSVMKFSSANWALVGNAGFSGGYIGALNSNTAPSTPSIAIDKNNVIYVAYADDNVSSRATVMKFTQ